MYSFIISTLIFKVPIVQHVFFCQTHDYYVMLKFFQILKHGSTILAHSPSDKT
jgi:hypothetical protein